MLFEIKNVDGVGIWTGEANSIYEAVIYVSNSNSSTSTLSTGGIIRSLRI
jgi:hypothetical protein